MLQIVAGMRLSPEQVEAVLSLRELYLRTTAALYRRRRQLATVLQVRHCRTCMKIRLHVMMFLLMMAGLHHQRRQLALATVLQVQRSHCWLLACLLCRPSSVHLRARAGEGGGLAHCVANVCQRKFAGVRVAGINVFFLPPSAGAVFAWMQTHALRSASPLRSLLWHGGQWQAAAPMTFFRRSAPSSLGQGATWAI